MESATLTAGAAAPAAAAAAADERELIDTADDSVAAARCRIDVFSFPNSLWSGVLHVAAAPAALVADVSASLSAMAPLPEGTGRLLLTGCGAVLRNPATQLRAVDGRPPLVVSVPLAPLTWVDADELGSGRFGAVRAASAPGLFAAGRVAVKELKAQDGEVPAEMRVACQVLAAAHRLGLADLRPPLALLMPLGLCFHPASPDRRFVAYPLCEATDGVDAVMDAVRQRPSAHRRDTALSLGHVMSMTASMLEAANWLKEVGFVHTDLKPDNLLWRRWADVSQAAPTWPADTRPSGPWHCLLPADVFAVVGDLGGVRPRQAAMGGGTSGYWSPERATRARYCPFQADLYSIGKSAIAALTGRLLSHRELQQCAASGTLLASLPPCRRPGGSAPCWSFGDLLVALTATDAAQRPRVEARSLGPWLPKLPPLPPH